MTYAFVIDNAVVAQYTELPAKHWVPETDTTGHYERVTEANAASFGYLPVVQVDRPADTSTTTWDRTTTIDTAVTYGWVERPKTAEELDADDREAKAVQIGQAIRWLRERAVQYRAHEATVANHLATTNTMIDHDAVFYDGFADLLEALRMDQR